MAFDRVEAEQLLSPLVPKLNLETREMLMAGCASLSRYGLRALFLVPKLHLGTHLWPKLRLGKLIIDGSLRLIY